MAVSPAIGIFLPIFFSALIVCFIVLFTCAYCNRATWGATFFGSVRRAPTDPEKGRYRRPQRRRRPREVVAVETEAIGGYGEEPAAGWFGGGFFGAPKSRPAPGREGSASTSEGVAEEIEVVEVRPDP